MLSGSFCEPETPSGRFVDHRKSILKREPETARGFFLQVSEQVNESLLVDELDVLEYQQNHCHGQNHQNH